MTDIESLLRAAYARHSDEALTAVKEPVISGGSPRRGQALAITAAAAAVVAIAGVSVALIRSPSPAIIRPAASSPTTSLATTDTESEQLARNAAAGLLAQVHLPAGSMSVSSAPAPVLTTAALSPMSPNLIDESGWWTTPGTVADVLTYLKAHPPAGTTGPVTGSGSGQAGSWTTLGFEAPATDNYAALELLLTATSTGGKVAVRADAQVIWRPARTPAETVPVADVSAATAQRPGDDTTALSSELTIALSTQQIHTIVKLLNSSDTVAPANHGCPPTTTVTTLTFHTSTGPLVFTATGCLDVTVTAGGVKQPALEETGGLDTWIDSLFNVTTSPTPVGSVPPVSEPPTSPKPTHT